MAGFTTRRKPGGLQKAAGKIFENFNLDLMFGLPGQTIQELDEELETAFSFGSTHLSCYQLTLEPNILFCQISAQRDS